MRQVATESWDSFQLTELFYAYRKAKADCYHERSLTVARDFVEYESALAERLRILARRLQSGEVRQILREGMGKPRLSAKKLATTPKDARRPAFVGHGFFSDPSRAFHHLCDTQKLTPEFRLVGDFNVQMHIMSALWINVVGQKFDQALSQSSYGSRLRRYRADAGSPEGTLGKYHMEAIGSFQPYFGPYKKWRERGLHAIREELTAEHPVIAITMDLTSYYHRIDPAFMANKKFLSYAGIDLSDWELDFTNAFAEALESWSNAAKGNLDELGCAPTDSKVGGLPIGLSISRVVANVLLVGLDREIERQLSPVYYGRYVDDLFLVLRDPGTVDSMPKLLEFFHERTKCFPKRATGKDKNQIWLKLPDGYQGRTTLLLQQSKQKIFFLQGQGGLDLLGSIESQIRSVSSERRLMPSPDKLESMAAAKVLTAAGQAAEEADTLRRADGLSVRRLGWAVLLRAVETLARDLRQDDWIVERYQFYEFARNHILRPDKIFDHLDYLPRLLSLAVALMDWPNAKRLLETAISSINALEKATQEEPIKVNGLSASKASPSQWEEVRHELLKSAADAIIRSLRWSQRDGGLRPLSPVAIDVCRSVGLDLGADALRELSQSVRESDWAKVSYKDHLRRDAIRQRPLVTAETELYGCYEQLDDLCRFLNNSAVPSALSTSRIHPRCQPSVPSSLLPQLFPTRPYTTQEISLYLPDECVFFDRFGGDRDTAQRWARYVRAVRGVWVRDSLVSTQDFTGSPATGTPERLRRTALLGGKQGNRPIRLGISSLFTSDDSWKAAAHGNIDLSRERYQRIERLVNQAVQAFPPPTHLLLPELSLPERWIDTVSTLLRDSHISLVAGLDYHHNKSASEIHSEAVLVLSDDRLGFSAYVQIHQPKSQPAPGEEQALARDFGVQWTHFVCPEKPVYVHDGFAFGLLVCSELQNVKHRLHFQGAVDCVMVLSWNQDLETFSSLVESASLDVHAYIALVNNRRFGDSRVRVPAKSDFERDVCRLRGGKNEHVVVAEIDAVKLRAFQSRAKRWPDKSDPFKPVPEGFRIFLYRASVPE